MAGHFTLLGLVLLLSSLKTTWASLAAPPKIGELSFPSDVTLGDEVILPLRSQERQRGTVPGLVAERRRAASSDRSWGSRQRVDAFQEQRHSPHRQSACRGRGQLHVHGSERFRKRQCHSAARRSR
ncbi:hypothetical protein V5799_008413 [Amblyomma americanum]|uniref:Secreted protein n=1 Tax=Amblyomma americanum TaxID=6943 RepID=A0AAQ4FDH9_AMBAM